MIKIPACFVCKHCLEHVVLEEKDRYGKNIILYPCKAFPEGIPQLKQDGDTQECANGYHFEEE